MHRCESALHADRHGPQALSNDSSPQPLINYPHLTVCSEPLRYSHDATQSMLDLESEPKNVKLKAPFF